jgi:hypothetical protein
VPERAWGFKSPLGHRERPLLIRGFSVFGSVVTNHATSGPRRAPIGADHRPLRSASLAAGFRARSYGCIRLARPWPALRPDGDLLAAAADAGALRIAAASGLLEAAGERRRARAQADRRKRAATEKPRAGKAARAREKYFVALAADLEGAWPRVDALIAAKRARKYDQAVALLRDLGELARRGGASEGFAERVGVMYGQHARKSSRIARLDDADLGLPSPSPSPEPGA